MHRLSNSRNYATRLCGAHALEHTGLAPRFVWLQKLEPEGVGKISNLKFGQFKPDLPLLELGQDLAILLNALPSDRGYVPTSLPVPQDSVLDEVCRGAKGIKYYDNSTKNFAGDRTKLYTVDELAATDVSQAGGYDIGASIDPFWEFETYGEIMVACNISEFPQQFNKGDVLFSDMTEAPKASLVTSIGLQEAFLFLARLDQGGVQYLNKVAWNDPGDLTQWTPTIGFAGEQVLEGDGGPIRQILGGEFGAIFQDTALWTVEFVGLPAVFAFRQILTNHGLIGAHAATLHNNNIYYVNRTGFYKMPRQGGEPEPIGAGQVDGFFWDRVDPERLDEVQAYTLPQEDAVVWVYPSRGAAPGLTDRALVFSIVAQYWGFVVLELQEIFSGYSSTRNSDQVGGDSDTGLYADVSMDSPIFVESEALTMVFGTDNRLAFLNGAPARAVFGTGLLGFDEDGTETINKFRPLVEKHGSMQATMSVRQNLDDRSAALPTRELSKFGYFEFRTARPNPRGRYFQFGLNIDGGWDNLVGINVPDADLKLVSKR